MKFVWLFSVVFVLTGCCGIRFPGVPCYDELTGKNGKKITDPKRVPQYNNSVPEELLEDQDEVASSSYYRGFVMKPESGKASASSSRTNTGTRTNTGSRTSGTSSATSRKGNSSSAGASSKGSNTQPKIKVR